MARKYSLILLMAFGLCASGDTSVLQQSMPKLDGRIVGGFQMDITQAPWQVSLQDPSHFCGGSIISENWILTAAHCMEDEIAEELTIQMGSTYSNKGGQTIQVKRIIVHNRYNAKRTDFDFALLQLAQSLRFDATMKAIPLPDAREAIPDKRMCLTTGWGSTKEDGKGTYNLRGVEVPIVNQYKCAWAYRKNSPITRRMICAGFDNGGKDACQGDSGGPMVCESIKNPGVLKLFGIVSWGFGCGQPNYPGVYARVQSARDWIRQHTGV